MDAPGLDVKVDDCAECGGTFLDAGELKRLTGDKELAQYLSVARPSAAHVSIACPSCGSPMHAAAVGQVVVDVCEVCNGTWFDGDELDALKARPKDQPILSERERELEKGALAYDANRRRPPGEHQTKMVGALALGALLGYLLGRR